MQYRYKLAYQRQREIQTLMLKKQRLSSPFSSKPNLYQSQSPEQRREGLQSLPEVEEQIDRQFREEVERHSLDKMVKTIKQLDRTIELAESQSEQQSKEIERVNRLIVQFRRLVQAMQQECLFLQKENRSLAQRLE